ncbi:Zn-dependent protease with chaperone function [Geodermatophilus bullaregiensis]|uniref:M48 family metalloprotease n=1 Tax=Geodermatophilus bullaregiensis TaxID=1564160 RepID=UPI00195EBB6C|nr:M48 family metalloprotease [Geodermatophilus bullaregiensis]MBM7804481.1 Zn-dependent protease with chaperone function [Geodermatophilus bullaregiensis]
MSASEFDQTTARPPEAPRINVLALPSPTTTRSFLLVTALLTAGLFVGTWLHNALPVGDTWVRTVAACEQEAGVSTDAASLEDSVDRQRELAACTGPVEWVRAAWSAGGLLLAGTGGLVLLYAIPPTLRRRRRMRDVGPNRLAGTHRRFIELSAEAGLDPPPRLVTGHSSQVDAFSFGAPGQYVVALPKKVAASWRDPTSFDPLIRHELAHIAHHDVPIAWLSRSLLYALVPLLAAPVLIGLIVGEISLVLEFAVRAALLAGVAILIARAILRSREYDADLRAAGTAGGPAPLQALLRSARPAPGTRRAWGRALANHPDPVDRAAVLERPELRAGVPFLDGLAAAFLTALSAPLLKTLLITFLAPVGLTQIAVALAHVAVGSLLGATIGLALARQALIARTSDVRVRVFPVASGVAVGLVLGQLASLAEAALGPARSLERPAWLLSSAALGLGATVLVAAVSELWADVACVFRRPRSAWLIAVGLGSVVFATVLWMADVLRTSYSLGGWLLASGTVAGTIGARLPGVVALLLGIGVALLLALRRRAGTTPGWLIEQTNRPPWPRDGRRLGSTVVLVALLCGAVGALTVVGLVVLFPSGNASDVERRFYGSLWVAAVAGLAAALALTAAVPRRGPALALSAAPLASLVSASGLLAVGMARGVDVSLGMAAVAVLPPLGMGLALVAGTAGLALLDSRHRAAAGVRPTLVGGGIVAVALAVGTAAAYPALTGFVEATPVELGVDDPGAVEVLAYLDSVAPDAEQRLIAASEQAAQISADRSLGSAAMADRLSAEPAEDLRSLLEDVRRQTPQDPRLSALHQDVVAAVELELRAVESFIEYLRTGDLAAKTRSDEEYQQAVERHSAWATALNQLSADVAGD